jgi:hypothetical protein
MYRSLQAALFAALLAPVGACTGNDGYPPVARIEVMPGAVLENDGFSTAVLLDGRTSADPIDDPDGERPLRYEWEIVGDEYRIDDGSLGSAMLTVRFLGETPATIFLTVTDEDGNASTARQQLQLTLP